MANIRHLICRCGTAFTSQWPRNRKFCCKKCMLADWRERHRKEINEYSRRRRETAPDVRTEINHRYSVSEKGQRTSKLWRATNKTKIMARLSERYKNDPYYRSLLKSRQEAHALLKKAKHVTYVCNGCDSKKRLHAHHVNFNPFENRLDNLVWLCHWCHMRIHAEARRHQSRNSQN